MSDVFEDNNGALTVARTPRITPQSKFFAVKLHFFKEHVKTNENPTGEINIQKVETERQLADILTKGLVEQKFNPLRNRLMRWDLEHNCSSFAELNLHSRGSVEEMSMHCAHTVQPTVNCWSTGNKTVCELNPRYSVLDSSGGIAN